MAGLSLPCGTPSSGVWVPTSTLCLWLYTPGTGLCPSHMPGWRWARESTPRYDNNVFIFFYTIQMVVYVGNGFVK